MIGGGRLDWNSRKNVKRMDKYMYMYKIIKVRYRKDDWGWKIGLE